MATEATNQKNAKQLFDHFGAERPFTEREALALLWPNLDYDDRATRDRQWSFGLRTSMRSPGGAAATSDHYLARADGGHMEPAPGGLNQQDDWLSDLHAGPCAARQAVQAR
jgi:hypothetical protein